MFHLVGAYRDLVKSSPPFPYKALCGFGSRTPDAQKNKMLNPRRLLRPHFRSFDLNNIDYQWLAGHSAF
jgi:hypothetical protein